MKLFQQDLHYIGHTKRGNSSGFLSILTSCHSGIELILLREILRLYDAKIIEVVEGTENSDSDHEYLTDLPWSKYCEVFEHSQ